jgi:cyclohexa-1,5-dienecarbonyl-CoA hydratase
MPEFDHIRFRIHDRVARLTLARPPLNIMNIAMMNEMGDALEQCAREGDLAAVVFDALPESRAFSAGVAVEDHLPETIGQMLASFHDIFRRLEKIARPTLAVVDGAALGGGCELVAACDIVIAGAGAEFGQPEIKLGVFPPVAAIILPRIIGDKKARELILLGEPIDAVTALRLGLVNHVVPSTELIDKTEALLAQLRALSSSSLSITRRALTSAAGGLDQLLSLAEDTYLNELVQTGDANEGLRAFLEKRKPEWRHQ